MTNLYDFTGKVLSSYQSHQSAAAGSAAQTVMTAPEYDHTGRLLKTYKTVNGLARVLIVQNQYDAFYYSINYKRLKELHTSARELLKTS